MADSACPRLRAMMGSRPGPSGRGPVLGPQARRGWSAAMAADSRPPSGGSLSRLGSWLAGARALNWNVGTRGGPGCGRAHWSAVIRLSQTWPQVCVSAGPGSQRRAASVNAPLIAPSITGPAVTGSMGWDRFSANTETTATTMLGSSTLIETSWAPVPASSHSLSP